jgi:hypothetical protein
MSASENLTDSTVGSAIPTPDISAADSKVDSCEGTNGEAIANHTNGHVENLPADNTSLVVKLSQIIARETEKVDAYFRENSIPSPSFDVDGPSEHPALPDEIQKARLAVVKAAADLKELMVGPKESLRWMAWDVSLPLIWFSI